MPTRIILRWFHSLTWLLIAAACLFWNPLAAAVALAVYVVFIVTMNRDRKSAGA